VCRAAIIADIYGFFTVGGGVGYFFVRGWAGLGVRRGDWSSPTFSEEGIVVVTAVGAVGGGGGAAAGDGLGIATVWAGGLWHLWVARVG